MNSKERRKTKRVKDESEIPWEDEAFAKPTALNEASKVSTSNHDWLGIGIMAVLYLSLSVWFDDEFPGNRQYLIMVGIAFAVLYFIPGRDLKEKLAHVVLGMFLIILTLVLVSGIGSLTHCSSNSQDPIDIYFKK